MHDVYIWRLQPHTADKFCRVRMYHSLCPPAYNEETIYLIDNDPLCQIVIGTCLGYLYLDCC
jgi:hypothetical protein